MNSHLSNTHVDFDISASDEGEMFDDPTQLQWCFGNC